jgi:hypothetical protein
MSKVPIISGYGRLGGGGWDFRPDRFFFPVKFRANIDMTFDFDPIFTL